MSGVLLIGVGNEMRGDDGIGVAIVRMVRRLAAGREFPSGPPRFVEIPEGGAALLDAWRGASDVILFDAVWSGAPAGTIHRLGASTREITSVYFHGSTHSFGVADAIELARALRVLPKALTLYGVEGERFEHAAPISPRVRRAGRDVAERVLRELCGGDAGRVAELPASTVPR